MSRAGTWWSTGSGRIELRIPRTQADAASHPGPCDADVLALSKHPAIARQLAALDPALVATELNEYGTWEPDELADHEQNLQRLLWIAAGDISEGAQ